IIACGLLRPLARLVAAIPPSLAQAMLAGILLPLCLAPFLALEHEPWLVGGLLVVWVVLMRFSPRTATPVTFAIAIVASAASAGGASLAAPTLTFTVPTLTWQAAIGISVPLTIVTMASQNVPGVAILAAHGYTVPWRSAMVTTGVGTLIGAPAGGHAIILAAITAALPASEQAHPNPERRWIATSAAGASYLVLALAAGSLTALIGDAPEGLIEAVAGLALLATFATAITGAMADASGRIPAALTLLIGASGIVVAGIGSAVWALAAGLVARALWARTRSAEPSAKEDVRPS
ncbi:MAG: benzoate/H(+) symporter BenE family transporter, partial [Demequina sp.]|uniref:benzoate/H(+) symporter BenE family transporter n=1 Tax=Demequina sp. TaxID=2050685 RepID=UPI003A8C4185